MSTFRIARHGIDMDTGAAGVDRRGVAVMILLCVALFAGCFAIGRATSPRSGSGGQSSASLPVAFAGAAVPFRLSSAPAIELREAAPRRRARVHVSGGRSVVVHGTPASAPALTQAAPRAQSPAREVARAPTPVRSQPQPAPASAREGEQSKPHTSSGAGTSFDSSG